MTTARGTDPPSTTNDEGATTSGSRPFRHLTRARSWKLVTIAVPAVLIIAEIGVRIVEEQLPPARLGDEQEMFVKVDQLEAIDASGKRLDVVFVGASDMDAGIDPTIFDSANATFDGAYNAALVGFPPEHLRRWLDEVVLPRTEPRLVVVGIQPFHIGNFQGDVAERMSAYSTAFGASLDQVDPDLLGRVDDELSEVSALIRYRDQLRSPLRVAQSAVRTFRGDPQPLATMNDREAKPREFWAQHVGPLGENTLYATPPDPVTLDTSMATRLTDQIRGGHRAEPIGDLLEHLLAADYSVVLVVPPVDLETLAASGMDPALFDPVVHALGVEAALAGVPFLDYWHLPFAPEEFHDKQHLDAAGAARLSNDLAGRIDQLCADGRLPACAGG